MTVATVRPIMSGPRSYHPQPRPHSMERLWWAAAFPGHPGQVREARRQVKGALPDCEVRDDLIQILSELAGNAVEHTRSRMQGGQFVVELAWEPDPEPGASLMRLAVGDQGGDGKPTIIEDAGGERQRGLVVVRELSEIWLTHGDREGRWVEAAVRWPDECPPGQSDSWLDDNAVAAAIARQFPDALPYRGSATSNWWASPPQGGMIEAAWPAALAAMLATRYREARAGVPGGSPRQAAPRAGLEAPGPFPAPRPPGGTGAT